MTRGCINYGQNSRLSQSANSNKTGITLIEWITKWSPACKIFKYFDTSANQFRAMIFNTIDNNQHLFGTHIKFAGFMDNLRFNFTWILDPSGE